MPHPFLDELKRDVVLHPDDAAARYRLAEALFADGDFIAASKQLEKALKRDAARRQCAPPARRAYERAGRPDHARRTLEALPRRTPDDVSTRDALMELLLGQGRVDDALVHARGGRAPVAARSAQAPHGGRPVPHEAAVAAGAHRARARASWRRKIGWPRMRELYLESGRRRHRLAAGARGAATRARPAALDAERLAAASS